MIRPLPPRYRHYGESRRWSRSPLGKLSPHSNLYFERKWTMTAGERDDITSGRRPLSARSVILSVLLAAHPPEAPVADVVNIAEAFGIQPVATRVALTRMVAAGDLDRTSATYRLSPRLLVRQGRQDRLLAAAAIEPWDNRWRMVAVASSGESAAVRAAGRVCLREQRFAELREGLWLRPDNLGRDLPPALMPWVQTFTAIPDENPQSLAQRLFDVDTWIETAGELAAGMQRASSPIDRITVAAAMVRHLLTDPLLPAQLLDRGWPGPLLRASYAAYQNELIDLRKSMR